MSTCSSTANLEFIRRDDTDLEITFKDIDGNPIDLTGCTVFFTLKKNINDPDEDAIIEKELTSFNDPELGIAIMSFTRTEMDIAPDIYWFDVQLKDTHDRISSTHAGQLTVTQDVTVRITV